MMKFKVKDRQICILQVYVPNGNSEYQAFVDDINYALQRVGSAKFTIFLRDFNEYFGTDNET